MSRRGDHIHKRKDGRWEGRYKDGYNDNGSIRYVSVYAPTYAECKKKLLKVNELISQKSEAPQQEKVFSNILFSWLISNRIRIKGATEAKYLYLIKNHIIPVLGGLKMSKINSDVINNFLDKKLKEGGINSKKPLSPSYVRTMAIIIEAAINYAIAEGQSQTIKSPINKPIISQKKVPLLNKQTEMLLTRALIDDSSSVSLGILLALQAGLRIGEVCALRWEDVDFETETIHIQHTISRVPCSNSQQKTMLILDTPKTSSSIRDIPITTTLRNKLLFIKERSCSSYVISKKQDFVGTRTFDYQYRNFLKNNGFPTINFHSLRHTYATRCAQSGIDAKTLSVLLGHSSSNISMNIYVHPSIELARNLLESTFSLN